MKKIQILLPIIFLLVFQSGCKKTDSGNNTVDLSSVIWKTAGVAGQVIDEQTKPVEGAIVKFGNKSTTTDVNGYFRFTQATFNTNEAFVIVNKTGYFVGTRTFIPRAGSNNYIKIQLLSSKIIGSVDAATGGTISMSNGVSIKLPANGIINSHNASFSGKVTVSAAFIDPTASYVNLQMPGDLMGLTAGDQQKLLKSFGMMAVELTSSANEKLNIKSGYTAILRFPIPSALLSSAPAAIPLWWFDESTGIWKEEGQADKQGNFYSGAINHFTFWNVDEPVDYVKLSMRVVGPQGNPVAGATVKLTSSASGASVYDLTDNLGYVDGYVPKGESLVMQVFDNCQNEVLKKNVGPFTTDTDLGDVTLANNVFLQTITGKVQDCDGLPLKSGTLQVLLDASHFEFTNIQDGSFSITFLNCGGNFSINLIAIDESVMQRSNETPLVLTGEQTDAGVLRACGVEIPPYFTISIDGVEQAWPTTVFGGWVETDAGYGDNSYPIELFEGDTSAGVSNRTGLDFSAKLFPPVRLPDSALLISIEIHGSPVWYQALDQSNHMVKLDNFGDVGKIMEGNFNGAFAKLYGCCPNSTVLDTVNISGTFRFRRSNQWWNH